MRGRLIGFSLVLFLALPGSVLAYSLRIHGQVTDLFTGGPLAGVQVQVYRDGVKQKVVRTGANGRYQVKFERGGEYVVHFVRDGFVTKGFAIDARGAAWADDDRVKDVEVGITLFEQVPDMDLSFFAEMPMGMGRFVPMTGMLSWNATYAEEIAPEVERLIAEVRARRTTVTAERAVPMPPALARP
jgi:hypothetical protein